MKKFEEILKESKGADNTIKGLIEARQYIETALNNLGSAAQHIREFDLDKWNELGEIYAQLKEYWSEL